MAAAQRRQQPKICFYRVLSLEGPCASNRIKKGRKSQNKRDGFTLQMFVKDLCVSESSQVNKSANLPDCGLPAQAVIHASVRRELVLFINESQRPCNALRRFLCWKTAPRLQMFRDSNPGDPMRKRRCLEAPVCAIHAGFCVSPRAVKASCPCPLCVCV